MVHEKEGYQYYLPYIFSQFKKREVISFDNFNKSMDVYFSKIEDYILRTYKIIFVLCSNI